MRLTVCFIASLLLHLVLSGLNSAKHSAPTLAVSLEPQNIALQIRTRLKKKPEPVPLPVQEPAPEKKPIAKVVEPRPKPEPIKKQKRIEKPKLEKKTAPNQPPEKATYVSNPINEPRLIERAEYLSNPPPEYPKRARRRGQEGTVTLLVELGSKGNVKTIAIQKSSGYSILDRAAKSSVSKWRFTPATVGDKQVSSQVLVPIAFTLNN